MIDFTSLFFVVCAMLGLMAGDAALFGDTLRVQIYVPQSLSEAGFTETSAEEVFMAEAAGIIRGDSVIPAPSLRLSDSPTVIAALAKPLSLDSVMAAMQNQMGVDHLTVVGALVKSSATASSAEAVSRPTFGSALDMILVVRQPNRLPAQIVLEQPDGDATKLVRRAAGCAMEQVSPYRVVLAHFLSGVQGNPDGFAQAKESAERFLRTPWEPSRSSERAMARNVLAMMDLLDNKLAEADDELAAAANVPNVMPEVKAEIAFNRAFIAVARKQPQKATSLLAESRRDASHLDLPNFANHLQIMEALTAWSAGEIASAEATLRKLLATSPENENAHHYLSLLLQSKGDQAAAQQQARAARETHSFETKTQGLAVVLVWTDPANGGLTPRN